MRNEWVGDIGDFGKYGLLRCLCGVTDPQPDNPLRLGVVWCLNKTNTMPPNYQHLKNCDSELLGKLTDIVAKDNRTVTTIMNGDILPCNTLYYANPLPNPCYPEERREWFKKAQAETKCAEIVYFDPDNGIAHDSTKRTSRKHIFPDELKPFYKRGQSLIIYHHIARGETAATQINNLSCRLIQKLHPAQLWALRYHRGTARVYFIVAHPDHKDRIATRLEAFCQSAWVGNEGHEGHFTILESLKCPPP